jgi:glycosyltransferase involved in cell wall biosynthesis
MSTVEKKIKVAIIYTYIPQYRWRFYEVLKGELERVGIELLLIYGEPSPSAALKKDAVELNWGRKIHNVYFTLGRWVFCWQPVLSLIKEADLVIVEMANKLLVNHILVLLNNLRLKKVAFWGHGRNFQAKETDRFSEWIKRIISSKVHWWFAYNNTSARQVESLGFPEERITIVQNSIDTTQLIMELEKLTSEDLEQLRLQIGISGHHVGLYVGGMYPEKCLSFLLDSLICVREKVPDFEMIFIGSGTEANLIESAAKKYGWIHYLGPKFNNEKVPYFALAQLFLMPGLVGLAVIDCLALAVPLVTVNNSLHSPEIEYLHDGENGLMVDAGEEPEVYAQAVIDLLNNENERMRLVEGCISSRSQYSVENMANNFANGIQLALKK